MRKIDRLKKEALEGCSWRNHKMTRFIESEDHTYGNCVCYQCGMALYVNTTPQPNEIDVGGQAVALNCTGN